MQVTAAVKSSAPMAIGVSTVFAIGLLCVAIAGLTYYYLKRRNQGFQFHYFRVFALYSYSVLFCEVSINFILYSQPPWRLFSL